MSQEDHATKRQKVYQDLRPGAMARSIDACQRCRMKKVKCDQNFPMCLRCQKAGVECVGVDRATGKAVPRSYIFHLEQKIAQLQNLLNSHGVSTAEISQATLPTPLSQSSSNVSVGLSQPTAALPKLQTCTDDVVSGGSPMYRGASLGITFAKLITAALKMKDHASGPQVDPLTNPPAMVQSPANLPPKDTAQKFVRIYFAHSNSQLPILHRETFLSEFFEPIYGSWDICLSPPLDSSGQTSNRPIVPPEETWIFKYKQIISQNLSAEKLVVSLLHSTPTKVPEQYHRPLFYLNIIFAIASSVNHLQYKNHLSDQFRNTGLAYVSATYKSDDPLEQLQAKLLLALFSLMRPCQPGVWNVLGQCLRICVALGLHNNSSDNDKSAGLDAFTKDRRRRLFWCTYSLDRQVCFYMGRPVGIPEASIKTTFPSGIDDAFIIKGDQRVFDYSDVHLEVPTPKSISLSFFRIRKIQLEVQRILYEGEELPRRFATLDEWKSEVQNKLDDWWRNVCELQQLAYVDFHLEFFGLNYNHTVLLLNGLSPKNFKLSPEALIKVSEALKNLMRCYTFLYNKKAINYTWAAVQNLFMAGTSFLYAIYESEDVRELYPKEVVKKVSEECITVLSLLIASCDAAKDCSQMFRILTAAILKIRYNESVEGSTRKIEDRNPPLNDPGNKRPAPPINSIKMEGYDQLHSSGISPQEAKSNSPYYGTNGEYAFEWVARKNGTEDPGVSLDMPKNGTPFFQESFFDNFLTEAANLSPANSMQDTAERNVSDYSFGNNAPEFFPLARDGRKAFDLFQLPTELIWGQFFTEPKSDFSVKMEPDEN